MKTRCKFLCREVSKLQHAEIIRMSAVTDKPADENGISEDNEFSKYSPQGEFEITISNEALYGKFQPGKKYYLDITEAPE